MQKLQIAIMVRPLRVVRGSLDAHRLNFRVPTRPRPSRPDGVNKIGSCAWWRIEKHRTRIMCERILLVHVRCATSKKTILFSKRKH